MSTVAETLRDFEKEEIIAWIVRNIFVRRPVRWEMLFVRWELESERLRADYDAYLKQWDREKPDFAERDRLAMQFNSTKDVDERVLLIKQMEPYDAALRDHIDRFRAFDQRQKRVDTIYKQYQSAFEKECDPEPSHDNY